MAIAHLPTPLERAPRLGEAIGLPNLLVKRDDLTGLALGGNKARKLALLIPEARAHGADTLVTGGGPQSNHARMTAAAAAAVGLRCELVLAGPPPSRHDGNLMLDRLFGAGLRFPGVEDYDEIEDAIEAHAERLRAQGATPFVIPVGGASTIGVCSYALAVDELYEQLDELRVDEPTWMVVADGSGGTHAGLLAGLGAASRTRVLGVDVGTRPELPSVVPRLAAEAATYLHRPAPPDTAIVDADHIGDGYGRPTPGALAAMRDAARYGGLVLDLVYSAKAFDALITAAHEERIGRDETVVFWHTGGAPAMFAAQYAAAVAGD